jgi:DNA gyrase subunit A
MLISDQGTLVRTRVGEIARVGRNTQGVTLIRLGKGEQLVNVEAVPAEDEEELVIDDSPESHGEPEPGLFGEGTSNNTEVPDA